MALLIPVFLISMFGIFMSMAELENKKKLSEDLKDKEK